MKRTSLLALLLVLFGMPWDSAAQSGRHMGRQYTMPPIQPADLLFFRDTTGMGAAISESTGQYTHVALVESVGDTIWIIDATMRFGVSRRPLVHPRADDPSTADLYRLTIVFDTAEVLSLAQALVGLPYDNAFLPDNTAYYCSELIQACFRHADGSPLFASHPMNWRNAQGELPTYWSLHFQQLGMQVPEGVPGTNPTDLSRSPLLKRIAQDIAF